MIASRCEYRALPVRSTIANSVSAACAPPHPCEEHTHAPMGSKSAAFQGTGEHSHIEMYATSDEFIRSELFRKRCEWSTFLSMS